jgi:hypothetical protein
MHARDEVVDLEDVRREFERCAHERVWTALTDRATLRLSEREVREQLRWSPLLRVDTEDQMAILHVDEARIR